MTQPRTTDTPAAAAWSAETLPALVRAAAASWPDATALIGPTRSLAYADLARASAKVAVRLRGLGLGPGDCLALILDRAHGVDGTVALLAAPAICTVAVIDPDLLPAARDRLLARVRARACLVGPGIGPPGLPVPKWRLVPGEDGPDVEGDPVGAPVAGDGDPDPEQAALLLATSGTTAEPRLVPIPHRMLLAGGRAINVALGLGWDDRLLQLSAPFHAIITNVVYPLVRGGSLLVPSDARPHAVADLCASHAPTWAEGVPALLETLAGHIGTRSRPSTAFRLVMSVGAPVAPAARARIEAGFQAPLVNLLGMSEALCLLADGRPICPALRLVGDDGGPPREGEPGELQTRGDHVFPGYLDDPVATGDAFAPDGWFRTGDLAVHDPGGTLSIVGRIKDQINRGGIKVAPAEIEAAILEHPAVAEAAAFGVPNDRLGEEVALALVLAPRSVLTEREARRWLLGRLSPAKVPSHIVAIDALPRTSTGKVSRKALAEQVAGINPP